MTPQELVKSLTTAFDPTETHRLRTEHNKRLGLTTLNPRGNSCLTAGIHPSLPDMFIKIITSDDPSFDYCASIMDGELEGSLFPKVHTISHINDETCILVMERLEVEDSAQGLDISERDEDVLLHLLTRSEFAPDFKEAKEFHADMEIVAPLSDLLQLKAWLKDRGYRVDFHHGNYGFRPGTRELVIFDPAFCEFHWEHVKNLPNEGTH